MRLLPRRPAEIAALAVVTLVLAWPMQGGGSLQNAHYVIVKALASGTATIEDALAEIDTGTNDVMQRDGRLYSNKAPGLGAVSVPGYVVFDAAGVGTVGDPTRMLWALGLFTVVLPALVVLLLVRAVAERVEPGFGTPAAVVLGLATLVLPFSTLFLSNLLTSAFVFGAFALLFAERLGPPRLGLVAAAGLSAGLAVPAEYQSALAVPLLGVYALARATTLPRAAAYGAGALVGAAPVLVYNLWAFGEPFASSYGADLRGRSVDLFGGPSLEVVAQFWVSQQGLLVVTPVLAAALVGVALLYRRGWKAEALLIGALTVAFNVFASAFYSPFGGFSPAPRYLVVTLPFLAIALAPAIRAAPLVTGALAAVSAAAMVLLTVSRPLAGYDGEWLERVRADDVALTAASLVDVTGRAAHVPLVLGVAVAGALAVRVAGRARVGVREPLVAGGAVLAWAALAALAQDAGGGSQARVWLLAAAAAAAVVAATVALRPPSGEQGTMAP